MTTPAIGQLAGGGTAFAVTDELALTAAHAAGAEGTHAQISFADGATVPVRVASVATDVDLALLELRGPLPAGYAPLRLSDEVASPDAFRARGYPSLPELDREVGQLAIAGEVTEVGTLLDGASTLQLSVREAAATQPLSLHGMSGGPVLVGEDDLVVGIVRWNPEQDGIAIGAIILATPATDALSRWSDRLAGVFVRPGLERLVRTGLMAAGELPTPSELDLGRLQAVVGPRSWHNGEAPYVERACDACLDAALGADGNPCVLVTGEPRAGKTRSAIEAVIRNCAEDRVVVPVDWDAFVALLERDRTRTLSASRLVWFLDDVYSSYLGTGRGAMEWTIDLLLARPAGATLVATIRSDQLARGQSPENGLVPEAARALQLLEERAGRPVGVERLSDAEELQRAAWAYPEEQFASEVGIAERLGRATEVRSRYRGETSPLRRALIRAAIDWSRVGRGPTVPSSRLREWFTGYVEADRPFEEVSDATYQEALAWARESLYPGSSRLALLAAVAGPPDPVYAVEDYLNAVDDGITHDPARAIPPLAWELALHDAAPDDTLRVCQSAVARAEWRTAARAGTSVSQMGRLGTEWNVRRWVVYGGDAAAEARGVEAETARAAAGDWAGFFNLAVVADDPVSATALMQQAAEAAERSGQTETVGSLLYSLGIYQWRWGDIAAAIASWRAAISRGDGPPVAAAAIRAALHSNGEDRLALLRAAEIDPVWSEVAAKLRDAGPAGDDATLRQLLAADDRTVSDLAVDERVERALAADVGDTDVAVEIEELARYRLASVAWMFGDLYKGAGNAIRSLAWYSEAIRTCQQVRRGPDPHERFVPLAKIARVEAGAALNLGNLLWNIDYPNRSQLARWAYAHSIDTGGFDGMPIREQVVKAAADARNSVGYPATDRLVLSVPFGVCPFCRPPPQEHPHAYTPVEE